jgi:hypothetical protein
MSKAKTSDNVKVYTPGVFAIVMMLAGLGTIVFLKFRKNGFGIDGWLDVGFYILAAVAIPAVLNLFFARVKVSDDAIEIIGIVSRKVYRLQDIALVTTAKGVTPTFKLREGGLVRLPSWLGTEAWGVAATLRSRMDRTNG